MPYKLIQYGCGPIGCSIARLAATKKDMAFVGAVDLENLGKDLGELAHMPKALGVHITNDPGTLLDQTKPDVALHSTLSSIEEIYPQLQGLLEKGVNVISTTEELSFPYREHADLATSIDTLARNNNVTVLGTGVNPGFLMDAWPLFMTGVCQDVTHIQAIRIQDASKRRIPFQKKIGAGATIDAFNERIKDGSLRHVGLPESVAMIAAGLGWELDRITETIEPVIAETAVQSDYISVKSGQAAGVRQVSLGLNNGTELIKLVFEAYLGAENPRDAVMISGTPNMEVVINGGVHGDLATAAMVVNSIPRVIQARPGLLTMKDLPPANALAQGK